MQISVVDKTIQLTLDANGYATVAVETDSGAEKAGEQEESTLCDCVVKVNLFQYHYHYIFSSCGRNK